MKIRKSRAILFAIALCGAAAALPAAPVMRVQAVSDNDAEEEAEKKAKEEAEKEEKEKLEEASKTSRKELERYYDNLMLLNDDLSEEDKDTLREILQNGKDLIDDADDIADLSSYVSETKGLMDSYIAKVIESIPTSTSEFLVIGDNAPVAQAVHGQPVTVIVPIYNMGTDWIDDITVTPTLSGSVQEWPFEIEKTGYSERITELPGSENKDEAWLNHREIHYTFVTREDVLSGYYKLEFNVLYRRNNKSETAKLYTFVKTEGAPGSGSIGEDAEESGKHSTPRIVVTGFRTEPEDVYAGDTFLLTIQMQNTSRRTAVSNIQIDLEAATEGKDENTLYAAFLPTSGSNSIYIDRIAPGGSADLQIEMTAKADLVQKPYALDVKMAYEDDDFNPYEASSSVSIPVKQEARFDTSTPEVMPDTINVGEQSNVMFSIYNTGKTTLYNVQVRFEAGSVSGGEAFVGKLESGATGSVDTMLEGASPTEDDGTVKVIISYEDDAGHISEQTKEITLFVAAEPEIYDDGMMGAEELPEEEGGGGGLIAVLLLAGAAVVITGIVLLLRLRKKKKKARELAEDLRLIETDKTDKTDET